jgi:transposase
MMSTGKFSADSKRDAVARITERDCSVKEVLERLGASPHALRGWKRQFASAPSGEAEKDTEIRRRA